ncbi:MAG TPA: carboxypeptidase regulatory-like domain-containing protein [Planctomycetota bacterium]|nr:carboxypeptidase regulatory-like domain-containing protein [Planctomycetota bacterium]
MKKTLLRVAGVAASLVLLIAAGAAFGCGKEETPPPAPAPTPIDPAAAGTVRGAVRFEGEAPKERFHEMGADAVCKALPPQRDESVGVVVDGKPRHVLVRIVKGLEGKVFARPETPVIVDQVNCLFTPRISTARVGQWVTYRNSDPTAHNVNVQSTKKATNRMLAGKGTEFRAWYAEVEPPFRLKCDVHPWMTGYVAVVDHPFASVTADDGTFAWNDPLPAGEYVIEAWHEAFPAVRQTVKVEAGKTTFVEFVLRPAK